MKKLLLIVFVLFGVALYADVYCSDEGDGVMWCYDDEGNNWFVQVDTYPEPSGD